MKTLPLFVLSTLIAFPALAHADTLYFASFSATTGLVQEQIDYAAVGSTFKPGTGGGSITPPGSTGTVYSTVTVGDLNGDGHPDIMAMIQAAIKGNQVPTSVFLEEKDPHGNVVWSAELDQAVVYRVQFGGSIAVTKPGYPNGPARPSVTFASILPAVQTGVEGSFKSAGSSIQSITFSLTAANPIGTGPQSNEVGDLTLEFPLTPSTGAIAGPPSNVPVTIDVAQNQLPFYIGWFNSVVQSGQDYLPATFQYSFADGSTITVDVNIEVDGIRAGSDNVAETDDVCWPTSIDWGGKD